MEIAWSLSGDTALWALAPPRGACIFDPCVTPPVDQRSRIAPASCCFSWRLLPTAQPSPKRSLARVHPLLPLPRFLPRDEAERRLSSSRHRSSTAGLTRACGASLPSTTVWFNASFGKGSP